MEKIALFPLSLGEGHLTRIMKVFREMQNSKLRNKYEFHFCTDSPLFERMEASRKDYHIHKIKNPKWVETEKGPNTWLSLLNIVLPVNGKEPLVREILKSYSQIREIHLKEKFDFIISDGDLAATAFAEKSEIPSVLITNQISPTLFPPNSLMEVYMPIIENYMKKADKIIIPDERKPNTICEYCLGDLERMGLENRTEFSGLFLEKVPKASPKTTLAKLLEGEEYALLCVTGSPGTKATTKTKYLDALPHIHMKKLVSFGEPGSNFAYVRDKSGKRHKLEDALAKNIDWTEIVVGYLGPPDKDFAFQNAQMIVALGSHNLCGEIAFQYAKPVVGTPIYDEHMDNLLKMKEMGTAEIARKNFLLDMSPKSIAKTVMEMHRDINYYARNAEKVSRKMKGGGVGNSLRIIRKMLK